MRLAIALAALALILSFKIADEAGRLGEAVAQRFLERGNNIPPRGLPITKDTLEAWAVDPNNGPAAYGYACRIIPLDLIFLCCLGCFLALASAALAKYTMWLTWISRLPFWSFWVLPSLYMLSDLAEDVTIARSLTSPGTIEQNFGFMRFATQMKLGAVRISFCTALAHLHAWRRSKVIVRSRRLTLQLLAFPEIFSRKQWRSESLFCPTAPEILQLRFGVRTSGGPSRLLI
jgi:hypothetical protein